MTGQPSDITLSLILTQGNNFKLKRKLFPMFPVYWYISRKCLHLPTELSLTIMNNEFLDIIKNSTIYIPNCCLNLVKKGTS